MRVCLVASNRYPVAEPFAGGLEALTHHLARLLVARGHDVTLYAADGSDPALPVRTLTPAVFRPTEVSMRDVNAPAEEWMGDHHAYLDLVLDLVRTGADRFDVVHNHSLHHLPVAMAGLLPVPLVTTLHTPPLPWLESAVAVSGSASEFTAVSECTARAWAGTIEARPVLNGVDTRARRPGPGGGPVVWTGRLVREKAPHLAVDAARVAGREEPYGLVAAEAMSCGTPVAAFGRGALPEIVAEGTGVLCAPDDVAGLAAAIDEAAGCDRRAVRRHAVRRLSAERMVAEYEQVYASLAHGEVAA
ncbi:glycosyltransferase [uncultured Nocardioides sp.]|uniref:glycosyltransferase n=1 Tax=uncultured Nocardioides sp. TaxID=198441 RepID=UPI0026D709D8